MKHKDLILLESPIPMACIDAKMHFINANNKFVKILNLESATQIHGKAFSCYFESLEILSLVERFIKSEQITTEYHQTILVDRKIKLYKFNLKKMYVPEIVIAIYAEDHTMLLEITQELEALKAASISASRMAILGEMAAGIAHEINNPLVIIAGLSDQILRATITPGESTQEEIIRKLGKIKTTTMRIGKIVKGLKSYARDGSGDPFQSNLVKDLINDSLALCTDQLRTHEINLIVEDIDPNIELDCRGSQISQVILNLIGNAKDAIKDHTDEKWIRIGAKDVGDAIEFHLVDSGKGIAPEIREKILQPFFTTKAVGEGTGLGLTIIQNIIVSHHGKLSIDPNSINTTFIFSIPKGLSNHFPTSVKVD